MSLATEEWTDIITDIGSDATISAAGLLVDKRGLLLFGGTTQVFGYGTLNEVRYIGLQEPSPTVQRVRCHGTPPSRRYGHSFTHRPGTNEVYVFGGTEGFQFFNDLYCLDLATWTWCKVPCTNKKRDENRPSTRYRHCAFSDGHRLYVIGGGSPYPRAPDKSCEVFSFHFATATWTRHACTLAPELTAPPCQRNCHAAVFVPARARLSGSDAADAVSAWFDEPRIPAWFDEPRMPYGFEEDASVPVDEGTPVVDGGGDDDDDTSDDDDSASGPSAGSRPRTSDDDDDTSDDDDSASGPSAGSRPRTSEGTLYMYGGTDGRQVFAGDDGLWMLDIPAMQWRRRQLTRGTEEEGGWVPLYFHSLCYLAPTQELCIFGGALDRAGDNGRATQRSGRVRRLPLGVPTASRPAEDDARAALGVRVARATRVAAVADREPSQAPTMDNEHAPSRPSPTRRGTPAVPRTHYGEKVRQLKATTIVWIHGFDVTPPGSAGRVTISSDLVSGTFGQEWLKAGGSSRVLVKYDTGAALPTVVERIYEKLTEQPGLKLEDSVFVAHSMGGLIAVVVLAKFLLEQGKRPRAALLFDTPWFGLNPSAGYMIMGVGDLMRQTRLREAWEFFEAAMTYVLTPSRKFLLPLMHDVSSAVKGNFQSSHDSLALVRLMMFNLHKSGVEIHTFGWRHPEDGYTTWFAEAGESDEPHLRLHGTHHHWVWPAAAVLRWPVVGGLGSHLVGHMKMFTPVTFVDFRTQFPDIARRFFGVVDA